jgi:hypothetical protein
MDARRPKLDSPSSFGGLAVGFLPPPSAVRLDAAGIAVSRTGGTRRDARRLPCRLDENESFGPIIPDPPNDNPEQPIESIQSGARPFPFVNSELLAKSG